MRSWILLTTTVLLFVFALAAGIKFGLMNTYIATLPICCAVDEEELPIISHGITPQLVYDGFYDALPKNLERNGAGSAVVAHHLIVGKEIANIFETVGDSSVKQVVLVSPNHFNKGNAATLSVRANWSTPYGEVKTNSRAVRALVESGVAEEKIEPFMGEHGINSLIPFVKRSFPDAEVIPLILHESLTREEAVEIARTVRESVSNDAVFIASVDMSHNLPLAAQQFHDELTKLTLASGELKHDLEIDSNAGLRTLFSWNQLQNTQVWNQTYHGSSLEMGAALEWQENTSHIMGYFTQGQPDAQEWTSFFFGGDVMLDRGTRKKILEAKPSDPNGDPTYPWAHMRRFMAGVDKRVVNLEGTINEQPSSYTYDPPFRFVFDPLYIEAMKPYVDMVSLANNHAADVGASAGQAETHKWLKEIGIPWFGKWETPDPAYDFEIRGRAYRLIGYHAFQPDIAALERLIKEGETTGQFVIVMPHWGVEYEHDPFSGQTYLAQRMVDWGADLIVGAHPHVVQGIDVLKPSGATDANQVPVLYSLGNFIFDQQIRATWDAMAIGVIHTEDALMLYFLPIGTKNSQPIPYGGEDAARVLNIIANASPELWRNQIQKSMLTIPYGN